MIFWVPVLVACDLAELVRSLHVYGLNDGKEKQVEREFLFKERGSYVEMQATPILKLRGFQVSELFQGRAIGLWLCIFAFGAQSSLAFVDIPPKLLISRYICFHFCFFFSDSFVLWCVTGSCFKFIVQFNKPHRQFYLRIWSNM